MKNYIAILISGGIDSTISTWILKKLNFKILGVFVINWKNELCKNNFKNLIIISNIINIKIKILNLNILYKKKIFKNLIKNIKINYNYLPDLICNKIIKFNFLIKYIKIFNINFISTGHYSKIFNFYKNNKIYIKNSKDKKKNQNYFLNILNFKKLSKIIFPLGNINKFLVRKIAKKLKIFNFKKKDSTGICFIENKKFKNLLNFYFKKKFGFLINNKNKKLGLHYGYYFYNIGMKKNIIKKYYIYKKFKNNLFLKNNNKNLNKLIIIKINKYKNLKNFLNFYLIKYKNSIIYNISFIKKIKKNLFILKFFKNKEILNLGQVISIFNFKKICLFSGIIVNLIN